MSDRGGVMAVEGFRRFAVLALIFHYTRTSIAIGSRFTRPSSYILNEGTVLHTLTSTGVA
jgi:hypothetical protein